MKESSVAFQVKKSRDDLIHRINLAAVRLVQRSFGTELT